MMAILYTSYGGIATSILRFLDQERQNQQQSDYAEPDIQNKGAAENQAEEGLKYLSFHVCLHGQAICYGSGLQRDTQPSPGKHTGTEDEPKRWVCNFR